MEQQEFTLKGQKTVIYREFEKSSGLKDITISDSHGDILPGTIFFHGSETHKSFYCEFTKEEAYEIGTRLIEFSEMEYKQPERNYRKVEYGNE